MAAAMFGSVAQAQARHVAAHKAAAAAMPAVPAAMRPPEGLCRVWVDGAAPDKQEGVSDCAYARAHVPAGGRVLEGKPASAKSMAMNEPYAPYYYGPEPIVARARVHATAAKRHAHAAAKAKASSGQG
jgi:hypothetical protein